MTAAGEVVTWGGDAGDSVQMQGKLRQVQQMLGGVRWRDMVFDGSRDMLVVARYGSCTEASLRATGPWVA